MAHAWHKNGHKGVHKSNGNVIDTYTAEKFFEEETTDDSGDAISIIGIAELTASVETNSNHEILLETITEEIFENITDSSGNIVEFSIDIQAEAFNQNTQ